MSNQKPHVVIVGGGFGGLAATKALRNVSVRVTLIVRTNHHVFQPLLYQVATSVLAPTQIGTPLREILRSQQNATVLMGEVSGVDTIHRNCTHRCPGPTQDLD
jgi:NADH:ubiquinone reductase (H+-translocating)